jgi:phosphonate transport system substrate-binding protein
MKRALLRPLLLLALLCAGPASAQAKVSLVLGLYPSEKPRNMVEALRPSLNAVEGMMESRLGEEVEIRIQMLSDYVSALNALVAGEVDFARIGPASYVLGKKEQPGLELLAMENSHGGVTFKGMIVVRDDSDLHTVADLKGHSFAFVSERSTLGRFFPQAYLAEAGISAADLGAYDYVGHHEAVGLAVWAGRFDAGALNSRMYEKLVDRGVRLRAIASFENVTRPWVARSGLPVETAEGLRQALLSLDDPEILEALGFDGFLPAVDNYYEPTRRLIAEHVEDYSQYAPKDTSSLQ